MALAALAGEVTRVRLGTLVLCEAFRPAAVLAKALASLDVVCGGRLDVGIGAGWYEPEYAAIGMDMPRPGERLDRLREAIEVLRGLLGGGPCTFDGRYHRADGACERAARRCSSRRRRSSWAARAIGCSRWSPRSPTAGTRAGRGRRRRTRSGSTCSTGRASAVGRDPATVTRSLGLYTLCGEDERDLARRFERLQAVTPPGVLDGVTLDEWRDGRLVGTVDEVREQAAGVGGARGGDADRRGSGRSRSR